MKAVILAGGLGTRISEESAYRPKPMVEIGGMPILWHIMKELSCYNIRDFIICAGYKQEYIKNWFNNYFLKTCDVRFDYSGTEVNVEILSQATEKWTVTVIDTGLNTDTGGRLARVQKYIGNEPFLVAYGDGVSNINIDELMEFHKKGSKPFTITLHKFAQNKGVVEVDSNGNITTFREKSVNDATLINIGYMILEPSFFNYDLTDSTSLEKGPITYFAEHGLVNGYMHEGFWQCMDTIREKNMLENLWSSNQAPWKIWE